jgi:hypothetical protein
LVRLELLAAHLVEMVEQPHSLLSLLVVVRVAYQVQEAQQEVLHLVEPLI